MKINSFGVGGLPSKTQGSFSFPTPFVFCFVFMESKDRWQWKNLISADHFTLSQQEGKHIASPFVPSVENPEVSFQDKNRLFQLSLGKPC